MRTEFLARNESLQASVKGVMLAADDSTEVRRQKLARIILDAMYQFLGLLDVNGTVLEINKAALEGAGVCLDDVVGKPFWEARWWAVSEDSSKRVREMVEQARRGEFVRCDVEVYGDLHGEKTIFVDFSLTPIYDDEGSVAFLLPEGRNITEKIAIEAELTRKNGELQLALEKLREIDGFKTKFFANVSHELRTPLALILGPVDQLLKEATQLGERERFRLTTIKRNAQSLLHQVNDLLDLARIDAQQMPLAYVCANVSAMLRDVAASFAAAAEERSITLLIEGADELYADVDRAKLARVLANLLSNAFKFTPAGGRICCSITRVANRRFLLSVQDNGPGVPPQMKEQIFSRFAQGQDGLSGSGSGLGLNIVKEFVELHFGTVVALDAPGGGAIFQVEMPMRAPKGVFVRESSEETGLGAYQPIDFGDPQSQPARDDKPGVCRILVVEDNPDLRHFLYDVLIDDYNVTLAENGAIALSLALESPPDLIITDLMMPYFDGEQFVRELRASERFPNIPVLVLSARADDALRETLLEELVQDYLTKPFSPQELRARVRNLVMVKRTVDILQKELNSQASDVCELTAGLVSSRKSLQDGLVALQISERRWQGLYKNTAVGIALADREGRILKANPALQRMLGYNEADIVGVSFVDISEESQRAMTKQNVDGLFDGVIDNYHVQKRYEKRNGDFLWVNVSVSLIPAVDREGPRLAVIVEDVTSRKQAETSLAVTQAELARVARFTTMGELVASIAHEVNQPLSAIATNSQAALRWLARETPDLDEVVAALRRVNRDASLAGEVITRIRSFLRMGGIKREVLDVKSMLDNLLQMLQTMLHESGVQVDIAIAPDLPVVHADLVQLQQVMLNLVVNAVDAMRDQPLAERVLSVTVTANKQEGALFKFSDTGPGIPPEMKEKIFDALFSTKRDGLGMGLAISRSIIENHGGRLRLETAGAGAKFVFNIPISQ
ncbi:ATP-binding protein [Ferribacterium limneticum]|uniref:ATP-binding protein n=1 Tax=Ferribacterium limneticum TaxID=76259 RepID=UPI001CF9BCA9|nr:ATP-binding protein [Ferribacterium limneticum]UCV20636.1 PAS domain S-box protein [Ferribacterium limneticum]